MDIFVEPMLPKPQVVILGASPVAIAVADFARRLGFAVTVCAPAAEQAAFADVDRSSLTRCPSKRLARATL
jgi:xanthine dehydrogenase accessory factor